MIFGLSDLHLDITKEKDMSVFGDEWKDYEEQIFNNWIENVNDGDIVLIPGDISWAMRLDDAYEDLKRIDELPGRKIFVRGNHDYWWGPIGKLRKLDLPTCFFLQNDAIVIDNIHFVGTRAWSNIDDKNIDIEKELKIFEREKARLELSLSHKVPNYLTTICLLHYPPFQQDGTLNAFGELLAKNKVEICVYGHLHSEGLHQVVEGLIDGVEYHCISADYLQFNPKKIVTGKEDGTRD